MAAGIENHNTYDKRVRILGVPVDMVNRREAMEVFQNMMNQPGCGLIVTPNSEIIVRASKDDLLKGIIERADLIIPDGIGLVYASRIMGVPLQERVTGIDFLESIIGYLEQKGKSIYFFGSKPGIAEAAAEKIKLKYPGLKVVGTHHGYFKHEEEISIVEDINHSGADFLCVALGSPKQEKFISDYKEILKPLAGIGVGGSLDVWAGTLKRAPEFYQKHGLEWLYRLIQEPSRYKRMAALPLFMLKVFVSRVRHGKQRLKKKDENIKETLSVPTLTQEEKMATNYAALAEKAREIRIDIIRQVYSAGSGHPGGSLSAADILTMLYFHEMNIDPKDPNKVDRDKFVLSKGHAAPVVYAALAERGYFPKEELLNLRKMGSMLQGHPDKKKVPGVEMSTGSLGQGLSTAVGMALANKVDNNPGRIYVLIGDGEMQEGLIWEATMAASHFGLDNLTIFVDWNGLQIDGDNDDVMEVKPVDAKFKSFNCNVLTIDGHNLEQIEEAISQAKAFKGKPTVIVAKTIKGKGVSFMENNAGWHGKGPKEEEAKQAILELGGEW